MSAVRSVVLTGLVAVAAVALGLAAAAQTVPVPIPAPRDAPNMPGNGGDPLGDLLARLSNEERADQAKPVVIGLQLTEEGERTRFVVELSDSVNFHVFTLADPYRVVLDLPEVLWRIPESARPNGNGQVQSYRYGLFREGNSRFVIDLNSPAEVSAPELLPPEGRFAFRLSLELAPTSASAFIAGAGWPEEREIASLVGPSERAIPPQVTTTETGPGGVARRVIVLDAGHGGIDPGTHGSAGAVEKNVVLVAALRVRDALEATGRYTVHLTRDSDVFIPLRGRVDIARAANADLFISLHADSHERRDIRGASVYTLSEDASDREAARLAEKENMSDVIAGVDLSGDNNPVATILIDLAQRDTMNRSVRFAETIVSSLSDATYVRPTTPHRSAGFAVLKAPDVPAVLIEMGYLTNQTDESEMVTEAWRLRVAQAITAAVDRHFGVESAPRPIQAAIP